MSLLYNNLSIEDTAKISYYIDRYSHRELKKTKEPRASTEYLLRFWSDEKEDLYHLLGDNFIIKKDVLLSKPMKKVADEIEDCIDSGDMRMTYREMREFIVSADNKIISCDTKISIMNLFSSEYLAENKYDGSTFAVTYKDKRIVIEKGSKVVKMIGKLVNLFDLSKENFEKFRIAQSMHTNEKKMSGKLCLSIHPLDYMTMSDNDSDWSSCMSWKEEGCYCRGTVEMMNSRNVIVAYLESSNPMTFFPYEWNNKKWRELFFVHENFITGIKDYPYRNEELTNLVLDWIAELSGKEYTESFKYDNNCNFYIWNNSKQYDVRIQMSSETMYNDFDHNYAIGRLSKEMLEDSGNDGTVYVSYNYSGVEECMYCGGISNYFTDESKLICDCCDEVYTCTKCGAQYYNEEDLYEVDGEYFCEDCFESVAEYDNITSSYHLCANMLPVYVVPDDYDGSSLILNAPDINVFEEVINDFYYYKKCGRLGGYFAYDFSGFHSIQLNEWGIPRFYIKLSELGEYSYQLNRFEYSSNEEIYERVEEVFKK